jgi:hypothetical protein
MNNTFNLNRFLLLFKKHSLEHAKIYLLSFIVLMGLVFLVLGFNSYTSRGQLDRIAQQLTFIFIMLGGGSIFTSMSFIELGDKKKAIPFLTLPASHFEKYLVAWLYSYVIFQLVFIGGFYLVDYTVIHLGVTPVEDRYKQANIFSMDRGFSIAFVYYALFNGLTLWGAVFFEKMHFIKTAVIFFICLIILVVLNNQLLKLFIGDKDLQEGMPFQGVRFNDETHYWRIYPDQSISDYGKYIIELIALFLWTSAFFRLKEKEV